MSASLVGSEMCIRDRCPPQNSSLRPLALAATGGRGPARPSWEPSSIGSVTGHPRWNVQGPHEPGTARPSSSHAAAGPTGLRAGRTPAARAQSGSSNGARCRPLALGLPFK
eukprot:10595465-Alexandrium_andersonii.AAC.1